MEPSIQSAESWEPPGDPSQRAVISQSMTPHAAQTSVTGKGDKDTEGVTPGGDAGTPLERETKGTLSEVNAEKEARVSGVTVSEKSAEKEPNLTSGTLLEQNAKTESSVSSGTASEKSAEKEPNLTSGTVLEQNAKTESSVSSGTASEKKAEKEANLTSGTVLEQNAKTESSVSRGTASEKSAEKEVSGTLSGKNAEKEPIVSHGKLSKEEVSADDAETSSTPSSDAVQLVESAGGDVTCVPVVDSEVEVGDTEEVEAPVADILDVEVPIADSTEVQVPLAEGVEVEMEVQVSDMMEVEVPSADSVEDVETTPMKASENEPSVETVDSETRAMECVSNVEKADGKEVVEMTPAEESTSAADVQVVDTLAEKSSEPRGVQLKEKAGVRDGLNEPSSDPICMETAQSLNSAGTESADTPGRDMKTTPAEETSEQFRAGAEDVKTTPAEGTSEQFRAGAEDVKTTPAEETSEQFRAGAEDVKTTPAEETSEQFRAGAEDVKTTPAGETSEQFRAGAEDVKTKLLSDSSYPMELSGPDAGVTSADRATTPNVAGVSIEREAGDTQSPPVDTCNPQTSDSEDVQVSPAGGKMTPSTNEAESNAGHSRDGTRSCLFDTFRPLTSKTEDTERSPANEDKAAGMGHERDEMKTQKMDQMEVGEDPIMCSAEVEGWGAEPGEDKKPGVVDNENSSSNLQAVGGHRQVEEVKEKGDGLAGDGDVDVSKTIDCYEDCDEGVTDKLDDNAESGIAQGEDTPAQVADKANGKKQDMAAASVRCNNNNNGAAEVTADDEMRPELSHVRVENGSRTQVNASDRRGNFASKRSASHERFGNIFEKFSQGGDLAEGVAVAIKDGENGGPEEEKMRDDNDLGKASPVEKSKPRPRRQAEDLQCKEREEELEQQSTRSSSSEEEVDKPKEGRMGNESKNVDSQMKEHDTESSQTKAVGDVERGESSRNPFSPAADILPLKKASPDNEKEAKESKLEENESGDEDSDDGDDESDEGEKKAGVKKEIDENSLMDSEAQTALKSAPISENSKPDKNSNAGGMEADIKHGDKENADITNEEAEDSFQSKLKPDEGQKAASSERDVKSVDQNQATQADFSDDSSSVSNSVDEGKMAAKHNSVEHDFIFTEEKEEDGRKDDGDNISDEKKSVYSEATDKDPGTPQFQFSGLKTFKTYSRKNEPVHADTDDLDTSEDEGSDDSDSRCSTPVTRGPQRNLRNRENGDVKEVGRDTDSKSLWKVEETRFVQDPTKSKPSIVSRITKALTSTSRNLGGAVPISSMSRDIGNAKRVPSASCDLGKAKTLPKTLRRRSNPLPQGPKTKPRGRQLSLKREGDGGGENGSTRGEVFECNICGKEFNALSRFKRHERSHSSGKRYCCDVCGKLFESQDKLDIHRQVHLQSANGTFTCPHCGEICKNWRPFLYHLSKHDTDGGKKYTCQLCGHTLFAAERLRRHTKHHKQGLNFCCFTCGKLFLTQERLDKHIAVHTSNRTTPTLPTPQRTAHKRSATVPGDREQPLLKRTALARAARKLVGKAESKGRGREKAPAKNSVSESENEESQNPASPSADEGANSGGSTPAWDHHSTSAVPPAHLDGGEVRVSSRKRSHSRKRCPCCPSSPTILGSWPGHHSKSDGSDVSSEKSSKPESGASSKSASPRTGGTRKDAPAKKAETEAKVAEMVPHNVSLRECSVKLERSPELSRHKGSPEPSTCTVSLECPLKTEHSASLSLRTPPREKKYAPASESQHTPASDLRPLPTSERATKKPAWEKSGKSASEKLKRPATDPYEGRKVKIYRTASEKLLPKNLALESASKERARRASKEKREKAAKAEKLSAGTEAGERETGPREGSPGSQKSYPCHICGKSLGSDKALKYHISDHVNAASPRLQAGAESVAHSLVYAKDLTPDKQGGYACNRCGYRTTSLADLWKHAKMHVEKGFQCKECCAAFAKPETLQHHMKAHFKSKA